MKVSGATSFATLTALAAAALVASPQAEAVVGRDNNVDWSSILAQSTAAWSQIQLQLPPEVLSQLNGFIGKAISAYSAAQHKREVPNVDWSSILAQGTAAWSQIQLQLPPDVQSQLNGLVGQAVSAYHAAQQKREVPLAERDYQVNWGAILAQGTAAWSQLLAKLLDHPELQAQVNGFISKAISAYGAATSSQQKREVMELAVRDFSDILNTIINLLQPIVSKILSLVDWNLVIVQGGTYLVNVVEQVYEWAKLLGALDKFTSWLWSNLGSILSTLIQWVLPALFGGSSSTTGNTGATTTTVAAAATTTAQQAKRMMY